MPEPLLRKVMIVEDEDDIRTVAEIALQAVGGLEVTACASGQEALDRLPAAHPQVLITDVMMPGMDGLSLLKAVRATGESIPVIFMTAKVMPEEVANFKTLGAAAVIAKPFDPMTLAEQVRAIWKGNPS